MIDIHSHILPAVDDGAKDPEESSALLSMMYAQGITEVIATPHFSPDSESLDGFLSRIASAKSTLENKVSGTVHPEIYYGCEIYYFPNMGNVESLERVTLAGSRYLLIDFTFTDFESSVIRDIKALYDNLGIIPIAAHVERYFPARGYKKLLKLIENGECICQINASSFFSRNFSKPVRKLVKGGYAQVIASDSHSVSKRPPKIEAALNEIKTEIGEKYYSKLLKSQAALKKSILGD